MCNFVPQYLPKLSEICAPLLEISNMNAQFCWSASQQTAFTYIKEMIISAHLLQYVDSTKPIILQVYASDDGLGGALIQAVACTSSTMTKSQKANYARKRVPSYCECHVPLGSVVIWPPVHYNRN